MNVISKVELSTTCQCYACETCNMSYSGEGECYECDTQLTPARYCDSICWEDSNSAAEYALDDYLKSVNNPEYLKIDGSRMGWQGLSGSATVPAQWNKLRDALTINGDYTLVIEITNESFTVRRSSHDEPTGARFVISPAQGEE